MALKITALSVRRRSQGRKARELELDTGSHHLTIRMWDDGEFEVQTGDYMAREAEDETPFTVEGDEAPDAIMAIQEFLGSL